MQANNLTNGPTIEQANAKPNVPTTVQPPQQRPQLNRADSRSAFPPQFRPQFPGPPPRPQQQQQQQQLQNRPPPPQSQIFNRGPPPQVAPRPPGVLTQQQFPPRPNFRPLTPFPRQPPPNQPRSHVPLQPQRSLPQFQQRPPSTEDLTRSQTIDGAELKANDNVRPNLIQTRSFSNGQETNLSVENRRMSTGGVEEVRNGGEEVPSRPESRVSVKMNKIVEDEQSSLTDVSQKSIDLSCSTIDTKSGSNNGAPETPIVRPATATISEEKKKTISEEKKTLDLNCPPKIKAAEGDNDSGVDESTQGNDPSSNGNARQQKKSSAKSRTSSTTPTKGRSLSRGSKSPSLKSPDSTVTTPGSACEKKKIPMNKVQVGAAPSPNLKVVKSKIGSLQNASYKPGGGKVKIENNKLDFKKVTPRIEAKNDKYAPKGGDKKIQQQKLQWNVKSKIGSLENTTYRPGGGDKKIESVKLDFKEKAKPKVGSKDNMKHVPGGGDVKIENRKIELNVQSKIGSLDNVKHRPGGGDKKIFDDKDYLKQKTSTLNSENHSLSGSQPKKTVTIDENVTRKSYERINSVEEKKSPRKRCSSARSCPSPRPEWRN